MTGANEILTPPTTRLRNQALSSQNDQQQQLQSAFISSHPHKWSIKEKLVLVSLVLLNGDSNWAFISDQLNKLMQFTSNYVLLSAYNNNLSNANVSGYFMRTVNQCSKQYKFIVKTYATRFGISDLKKIYNELVEERLKELKTTLVSSTQEYGDIYKEIEQILSMDTDNFDQLNEMWLNLKKKNESKLRKNSSARKFEDLEIDEDDENNKFEKQLSTLISERKKKEEEEAAIAAAAAAKAKEEAERLKRLEEEEAAAAAAAAAAVAEVEEAKRKKDEEEKELANKLKLSESVNAISIQSSTDLLVESLNKEIKQEENKTKEEEVEQINEFPTPLLPQPPPEKFITDTNYEDDRFSSDDDVPLVKLQTQKNLQTSSGIEWKPIVDVGKSNSMEESENKKKQQQQSESPLSTSSSSKNSADSSSLIKPKRSLRVIESSSSSSSSPPLSNQSAASPLQSEEDLKKLEEKTMDENETTRKPASEIGEQTELIFTPLINYDKISQEEQIVVSKIKDDQEENAKQRIKKETTTTTTTKQKSNKNSSKAKKVKDERDEEEEAETGDTEEENIDALTAGTVGEEEEKKEIDTGAEEATSEGTSSRVSSLRSRNSNNKRGSLTTNSSSSSLSGGSKRRSIATATTKTAPISNLSKPNLTIETSSSTNNSTGDKVQVKSSINTMNSSLPNKQLDTGLLSIIKSEPVQISATSTILPDLDNQEMRNHHQQQQRECDGAPFSSSSTSSTSSSFTSNKFEDEKAYRAWKKSIMMVLNNIACHKHATIFMQPVRDEIAPGYSNVVFRPMDLSTIKKNIESGLIKSTRVFQRDIMLMFTNAIMYNSSNHEVHKISLEMYKEVLNDVEQLLNAQEAMGEDTKPIIFKEKRSSTASDRGATLSGLDLERNESIESTNDSLANILISKKDHFNKDDAIETASVNSGSTVSTPLTTNKVNSAKNKFESNLSCSTSASTSTSASNTKKRRPSSESSSHHVSNNQPQQQQQLVQPKAKKRRKTGR